MMIPSEPVTTSVFAEISVLILLVVAAALTSATGAAFNHTILADFENGTGSFGFSSRIAVRIKNMQERLHATTDLLLILIIIAIVFTGIEIGKSISMSVPTGLSITITGAVILIILIASVQIFPVLLASRFPKQIALAGAIPVYFLMWLFTPVTAIVTAIDPHYRLRRILHKPVISMDELTDALDISDDNLDEDEKMLKGIVNFGNINASEIMCPRIDVTAININLGFSKIIPVIINSGFSRIPAYSESIDNIKGILYAKDVLPYMNKPDSFEWQNLLRPPYFVPETKKINELLKEFQLKKNHMAVVIDEYGGTSGIITLEDVLEEIVGEITDESDDDETLYRKVNDTTWVFMGKVLLNDFCEVVGIEDGTFGQVRGESETLAGMILELTGEIPEKNKTIRYKNISFLIEAADKRRIKEIRVELKKDDETEN
jgi:putative hemolysin